MNKEQILQLSGRELDGAIAEYIFGYTHGKTPKDYDGLNGGEDILLPPGFCSGNFHYPPKGKISKYYHVPQYSSMSDCYRWAWEIEIKIKSMGYVSEYIENLEGILSTDLNLEPNLYEYAFAIAHVSPIDRLRAALLTLKGVNE